ncbi:MAG: hypothetical protein II869_06900, partial [Synergistaceae bacterium]|nr:hypothetical protein [Synergistaceae bacterium]
SESPINTAQDQANQSLEHDINPFDELSENETHDEELPTEESNDDDLLPETNDDLLPQETNDDDLFPKENHDEPEESLTDFDAMTEDNTTPNDDEIPNDPFTIPDLGEDDNTANLEASDDETRFFADAFTDDSDENASDLGIIPKADSDNPPEATLIPEIYSEPEHSAEPDTLTTPEILPESEPELTPEISAEPKPESSSDDDDMPFPVNDEPDNVPLTEQEALIAMVNQQFETENTHKEAEPENNMPEQSLLNDETPNTVEPENENNDDWDISSLGELGQVATLADDNEDFTASPGTVTEMITQPEPTVPHNPEEDHKEKTMSIREKLALRKNKNSDGKSSGNSKSGFLMPLLVLALAVIGGLILWQLMQLSDKITSMAMNAPGYESVSGAEPPSYEYAIDFILDPNLSDRMSQRGRAGWQVVGSRRTQDSTTGQYGYEFIFMRRTPGR